jgi:hypothetical protein
MEAVSRRPGFFTLQDHDSVVSNTAFESLWKANRSGGEDANQILIFLNV